MSHKATVLVVDDNYMVRRMARRTLERFGYGVIEAASSTEALERLEEGGALPDLVLSDIYIQPISGLELTRDLRRSHPALRIVLMSGYPVGPADIPADVRFLRKPFFVQELLDIVEITLQ